MSETADQSYKTADVVSLLDRRIDSAAAALRSAQRADGHWVFELEADATIPAEYVLFTHYLGEEPDLELERKIGVYLRRRQQAEGGWPLFHGGALDMSATVKAYFALKMIGDDSEAEHMRLAREAVLKRGGAANVNVFTRILLALYGIVPWSCVPLMPVEIMLLPAWFPFHLSKISYWGRTVLVPLLVLQALKPRARNRKGVRVDELFIKPPGETGRHAKAPHQKRVWYEFFRAVDVLLQKSEPVFPRASRRRAIDKAVAFVKERLNGEDGLGAIFPAMVNSVLMFDALGVPPDNPDRAIARKSVDKLLIVKKDEAYCQPCVSPVWDTALAAHALLEAGHQVNVAHAEQGLKWLKPLQELNVKGDWCFKRPQAVPGGWAFQYANPHYPDLDDTAVIVMAMARVQQGARRAPMTRRSRARGNGSRRCNRTTAAGVRSMPTIRMSSSTTSPLPTTARCSIRPRRISPRAASRCWRNSASRRATHGRCSAASNTCAARNCPTAPGTAAGASTTSMEPGRRSVRSTRSACRTMRRRSPAPPTGSSQSRTKTAAGARTGTATSSTTGAMRVPPAPPRRPPGPCSA